MTKPQSASVTRDVPAAFDGKGYRRVLISSFIGSTVEFYDFLLYGTAAALVFGPLFFPRLGSAAALTISFATFAAGYLSRPLGAVVFGRLGDRIGRKSTLVITMSIMGGASTLIGVLPTAAQIGVAAPLLLLALRILQGIAVGGEWGGAALMALEHAPEKDRGFAASAANMGAPAGGLLGTLAFAAVALLPAPQLMAWGWRIPFLLSAVLVGFALYVRVRVSESPLFVAARERAEKSATGQRSPILVVFRRYPGHVAVATLASLATFLYAIFMATFGVTIARSAGLSATTVLACTALASFVHVFAIGFYARLSDRVGRKRVLLTGCVLSFVFAFPLLMLLSSGRPLLVLAGYLLGSPIIQGCLLGPLAAYISERFATESRYTGASVSYQFGSFLGSFTPMVCALLWSAGQRSFGNAGWTQFTFVGLFLVGVTAVSAAVIASSRETLGSAL